MIPVRLGAMPSETLDEVILHVVDRFAGKPCPTEREISEWTGLSRRRGVGRYLRDMQGRGVLEMEIRETREAGRDPKSRRMRRPGGEWTDWTQRGPVSGKVAA